MKQDIHPEYKPATIVCSCGNEIETRSTQEEIHVEICSVCHPFYTGRQKLVDTAGRVERFKRKYGDTSAGDGDAGEDEEAEGSPDEAKAPEGDASAGASAPAAAAERPRKMEPETPEAGETDETPDEAGAAAGSADE